MTMTSAARPTPMATSEPSWPRPLCYPASKPQEARHTVHLTGGYIDLRQLGQIVAARRIDLLTVRRHHDSGRIVAGDRRALGAGRIAAHDSVRSRADLGNAV